jgi:Methyltransferase domain
MVGPMKGNAIVTTAPELLDQAIAAFHAGRSAETAELCRRVLRDDADNLQAHQLWSAAELPGPPYLDILQRLHKHLRPATYVEIGVETGASMSFAAPGTVCVGIDPDPQIAYPLPQGARILAMTSDQFFAAQDLAKLLGGRKLDLAFIDGMHLFEYALRDFINLERYASPSATILVHDCYPLDERTAARERVTRFWTGDVWKLVLCLKQYRPDLEIHTVAAQPTGLAIIRRLDPQSRKLEGALTQICDEFVPLTYAALDGAKREKLGLVAGNWLSVKALLREQRHTADAFSLTAGWPRG